MLRISHLTERTGRYYLADLSPGKWHGSVAAGLGLDGRVEAGALRSVLSGAHPLTGRQLSTRATTVSGFDLTFSAPKSVSVLYALADAEHAAAVMHAQRAAVDEALTYVDAHALSVRRGTGDDRSIGRARGTVAALFVHDVSRALDPHVHTHVVVANCTHGVDGRWSALDSRGLYVHGRAAGALYDAALRHELTTRIGVSWDRRRSGAYEMSVVDPVLIGALSSRRAEIRSHLHDHATSGGSWATPSRRARAVAWAVTRDPKAAVPTLEALRVRWQRLARDAGWSGELARSIERPNLRAAARTSTRIDERTFCASLEASRNASRRAAATTTVTRRDVIAAWAHALETGAPTCVVGTCVDALHAWDDHVGVAEVRHPRDAVVPPPHVLQALGPRPSMPDALVRWLRGAGAIEQYRDRWDVGGAPEPLGVQGTSPDLAALPVRRLAEHVALTRDLAEIRRRLGHEIGPDVGRAPLALERSLGRG